MAQTTDNKASIAFKALFGKSHTDDAKAIGNEAEPFNLVSHYSKIFAEAIDSNPAQAVTDGVAEQITDADLVEDVTSNGHGFLCKYPTGHGKAGQIIKLAIPPSFGSGYEIAVKDSGGTPIPVLDARNWVYSYNEGVYFQQTPSASPAPAKADLYVYIGDTVQAILDTDVLKTSDIGTTVQAWDEDLDDIAAIVPSKGDLLVGNAATDWIALGKGTDGQVLSAQDSETSGLLWIDRYTSSDFDTDFAAKNITDLADVTAKAGGGTKVMFNSNPTIATALAKEGDVLMQIDFSQTDIMRLRCNGQYHINLDQAAVDPATIINASAVDMNFDVNSDNVSPLFRIDAGTDSASFGDVDTTGLLNVNGRADEVQLFLKGHSAQTANILEVKTNADASLFRISNTDVFVDSTLSVVDTATILFGDLTGGLFGIDMTSGHDFNINNSGTGEIHIGSTTIGLMSLTTAAAQEIDFKVGATLEAKIDSSGLTVSNMNLDGNTLSSVDLNGDVNITPNGTGEAVVGNAGHIELGDGTLREMRPQTTEKIDLGSGTFKFRQGYFSKLVRGAGGLVTFRAVDNTSATPTKAQLDTAFPDKEDGYIGILDDADLGTNVWACFYDGTDWFMVSLQKAV